MKASLPPEIRTPEPRSARLRAAAILAWVALAAGCSGEPPPGTDKQAGAAPRVTAATADQLEGRIRAFCGDCHAHPQPDTFPRDAWFDEVEQGYRFYHESGRSDLDPPPMKDVVAYYRQRAPRALEVIPVTDSSRASPVTWTREVIEPPEPGLTPGLSHLHWWDDAEGPALLFVADMNSGQIHAARFEGRTLAHTKLLGDGNHPAHIEFRDRPGDGSPALLVAGLGSALPADHRDGSVLSIPFGRAPGESTTLLRDVGRIADVRAGEFTADGIDDLIVAEFGWRSTGSILLLEGSAADPGSFRQREIDPRHGAIHVVPRDLDNDADLDFVALISQEHEQIVAYLNRGHGEFDRAVIFDAGDPSYGSSGIQLVDLDRDGDLDIVYTNGDTLDSYVLKPYHAIHWLENRGTFPFECHTLAHLPGAARALAGDLDGDGDLDIAACSYIPQRVLATRDASSSPLPSLLWLENESGDFQPHILESGFNDHLCLELADVDRDGRLDLLAGNFSAGSGDTHPAWLTVWWNDVPDTSSASAPNQ